MCLCHRAVFGTDVRYNICHNNHYFTAIITGNLLDKNWGNLLVQSFIDRMPLLMATSAFGISVYGEDDEVFIYSVIYTVSVPYLP